MELINKQKCRWIGCLTSYDDLIRKAVSFNEKLENLSIWPRGKEGRFQVYIKTVTKLNETLKEGKVSDFLSKHNKNGHIGFILKQLYEFTSILNPIFPILNQFSESETKEIRDRLKTSLSGSIFPKDENTRNNGPRNNQFELLLLSRLLNSGYQNVKMLKNPDILVNNYGRSYSIECKRVIGQTNRALVNTINVAIKQIDNNWNSSFFGGVVALDLSTKYEQGNNFLESGSHDSVHNFVQSQLKKDFNFINSNCPKLLESAKCNKILGVLLNISCVYVLRNNLEMGWVNEIAVGTFNKESPINAPIFVNDFSNLAKSKIGL